MAKKVKKPKPDVLAAIAAQTGTNKEDWHFLSRSSPAYARGYRYANNKTQQYAKRAPNE